MKRFLTAPENSYQRRLLLEIFQDALSDRRSKVDTARIVRDFSEISGFIPPRWKDLTSLEIFALEQVAGHSLGINLALTFNISDEQRYTWLARHKNLTDAFKKEIVSKIRHVFDDNSPRYWLVIEPKKTRGEDGRKYRDQTNQPRRFDVHAGFRVPDKNRSAFHKGIWKRTEKLELKQQKESTIVTNWLESDPQEPEHQCDYPLSRRGRMAYARRINSPNWSQYAAKHIEKTIQLHADVVGTSPFGASRDLTATAREIYQLIKANAKSSEPSEMAIRQRDFLAISGNTKTKLSVLKEAITYCRLETPIIHPQAICSPGSTTSVTDVIPSRPPAIQSC